jgi:hypothetical protein
LIPNPIVKVLSTLSSHAVRHLLMGGQACVFYGAAEFSRDCDVVLLADDANYGRLRAALAELQAQCIAVPPFDTKYLERGHAVHFRCEHEEARGMRLDVMTRMRGVDEFESLWGRRTTLVDAGGVPFELLGLHDLIKAKKTQRDKDWPMIRRLVESHYEAYRGRATEEQVEFWLQESRTPEMMIAIASDHRDLARSFAPRRPLLAEAFAASRTAIEAGLEAEERAEKQADRAYWQPLKRELEQLRRQARRP